MHVRLLQYLVITSLLLVFPFWQIFRRAGHNPAISLLMFIPIINLVLIYYAAFGEWPLERAAADRGQPPFH